MHASPACPFEHLRWNAQDIADAVPLRLHQIDLFDAAFRRGMDASANAARLQPPARLRQAFFASAALPVRFGIR